MDPGPPPLTERLLNRFGGRYVLVMLLSTRLVGWVVGLVVIYYVNLVLVLPPELLAEWIASASVAVLAIVVASVALGLAETPALRRVLRQLDEGDSADEIPPDLAERACDEAVHFNRRHHSREWWLATLITIVPLSLYMVVGIGAPPLVGLHIAIAGWMGIIVAEVCTYFVVEKWMATVVRRLLACGLPIDFENIPATRIAVRLNVSLGLIILVTCSMIGVLASQRTSDVVAAAASPVRQAEAVVNLRRHTVLITCAAVLVGIAASTLIADSVATRTRRLVDAMQRVGEGRLSERIVATGNDEIDQLTRRFNAMVERLADSDEQLRHLNAHLESLVDERTAELRARERDLEESLQRLHAHDQLKTEFFSNVSHELRTPLQMILAPLDRVLDGGGIDGLPGDVVRDLGTMRINGHRLVRLIGQLLDFARLEEGLSDLRLRPTDVAECVQRLVDAARPLATERGLELRTQLVDLPAARADHAKLETIVSNLLSNALKFTPRGGVITISAERSSSGAIEVSVADTGVGIAPGDLPFVFERFRQLDGSLSRKHAGTGLGMPLAKEYVELHGGRLDVESEPGRGTCFTFDLQVAAPTTKAIAPSEDDGARTTIETRLQHFPDLLDCTPQTTGTAVAENTPDVPSILVVDDSAEVRFEVGEALRDRYRIRFAADGAEGFAAAIEHHPSVVVSDVMMPEVDGYELCSRLRSDERTRNVPILLLTARAGVVPLAEGLDRGADDYLAKPFDPIELRARVAALVRLANLHRLLDDRNLELQSALDRLQEAQSQLVQSEKMRALGQLSAGIAHEINNATNAVHNGIRPLAERARRLRTIVDDLVAAAPSTASQTAIDASFVMIFALADAIEQGAVRTARIVRDLRAFSHPGREAFSEYDVHESLDLCVSLLSVQLGERVTIERDYCEDARIVGPEGRLNQVFLNVLDNAQQAIDGTGGIRITTSHEDESLVVAISDTGPGLPAEVADRIFDPFFTTKPQGEGTGLGLSVSYGIVRDLGGSITAASNEAGTTFTIRVPIDAATSAADERHAVESVT